MAIATKTKPRTTSSKKRAAQHHKHSKNYVKSYWPYLPMVALVAGGIFMNSLLGNQRSAVLGSQSNVSALSLLDATNQDRATDKLTMLQLNMQLQAAAQAKANDMVRRNYWSHVTPTGQQPWDFITAVHYQYQTAGENLAYGFTSSSGVLNAWMNSPEHRANLLNTTYRQVGFGIAESPNFVGQGAETVVVSLYALPTSGTAAADTTTTPITAPTTMNTQAVSRLQTVAAPAATGFIIGIVGTLAVLIVLIRHSIAWRKLLNRGELFVLRHPLFDISLVLLGVVAVVVNHTAGFIG